MLKLLASAPDLRKCSAGNWDWITDMHGFSARMDRAITRGHFFPPVSGSSGQGRR